jgi:hypothetical protein
MPRWPFSSNPTLFASCVAAEEVSAKEASSKLRGALPELEAAKDAAAKERDAAAAKKAALSKEGAARQTTIDRLRHERHDLLARVQTSQLTLPLKAEAAAAKVSEKRKGAAAGRRKGAAAAAVSDEDVDMNGGGAATMFSQGVAAAADSLDAAGEGDDADDRRVSRIDFSKLTLDTVDVSPPPPPSSRAWLLFYPILCFVRSLLKRLRRLQRSSRRKRMLRKW